MNAIKDLLLEFAQTYEQAITKINKLEDKSQKSAVNYQYANNIRHSQSHLCSAITYANSNPPRNNAAKVQITDAISHLKNLTTDSYEHIAGHSLTKTKEEILKAGSFSDRATGIKYHDEAVARYSSGRQIRTENPDRAIGLFEEVVELCKEARYSLKPVTKIDKTRLLVQILGWLVAFFLLLDRFFNLTGIYSKP